MTVKDSRAKSPQVASEAETSNLARNPQSAAPSPLEGPELTPPEIELANLEARQKRLYEASTR